MNFLPVRSLLPEGATVKDFLKATRTRVLEAYEHQNYTYGTLVRKLALPRDPSRLPLMEVQFNVEKVGGDLALPGLRVSVDPNGKKYANSDIFLNVIEGPDGLVLDCDFKTELFSKDTIRRWLGHFETLLEGLAGRPGGARRRARRSSPRRSASTSSGVERHRGRLAPLRTRSTS